MNDADVAGVGRGDMAGTETTGDQDRDARFAQAEPLIHVGPHKTATTWLQDVVLGPKDGEELVYCFDFPATHEAFLRPAWGDFDPRRARARLAPWLERSEETGLPLIVTDETLSGYPFHHRFAREVAALRMAEAFPRARILVTIREQKAVIDSMYGQYLRYGYASRIEEFVDPGDETGALRPILERAYYDYDRLLDLYEGHFGAGRVLMLPMEWMTRHSTEAMARLSAFIGAEITAPRPDVAATRTNEALGGAGRTALRLMNMLHPQDSRLQRARRRGPKSKWTTNALAYKVDQVARSLGGKRGSARHKAVVAAAIGDHYAASNARVSKRIGIDLGALGYPVSS